MKLVGKFFLVASFGIFIITALSACKSKGEAPVVVSSDEITISVNSEEPNWAKVIIVEDDLDEEIIVDESMIDASEVDLKELGVYVVEYTIPDSDGNTTVFKLRVNIVDKTNPIVDLRGESFIYLTIGDEYTEKGVIMYDNYDSDLSFDVVGTVDTSTIGEYFLNYTVTDSSGNTSVKLTRLVIVENEKQMVSDKDEVYFSLGDFEITKEDLYNEMIDPGGLYLLLEYVDNMLLDGYISEVTSQEITDELNRLTFNTVDLEAINNLPEIVYQNSVDSFNNAALELGYNPENPEDLHDYLALNIAKRNAFFYQYTNGELSEDFDVSTSELEDYYLATRKGEVCGLELRFNTDIEVKNVFNHFNLVPGYNEGFGEYIGDVPIEFIEDFNSINTRQLTNEETFSYFLILYNYLNPNNQILEEGFSKEDLCINYPEIFNFVYENILDEFMDNQVYMTYIDYIFDDLKTQYDMYSYEAISFGQDKMFVYKISQSETTDFMDLSSSELRELELEYIREKAIESDTLIEDYMIALRQENEFNIVEQFLGALYKSQYAQNMDTYKDPNIMASINGENISVDDFYQHVEKRLGYKYTVYLKGIDNLLNNGVYEELYGDNFDVLTNDSDRIVGYRAQLQQIKDYFELERYVQYGYSSFEYTWNEFMFLALNSTSETEALMNLLVFQTLTDPYTMSEYDFTLVSEYIQNQYDNFFDLKAKHLLLYVDFNKDFLPDDYLEYIEELDEEQVDNFNSLITSFDLLVRSKFSEGKTLEEIADEYNNNLLNDDLNEWAIYREFGFKILMEDLTSNMDSLNNYNTLNFDSSFREALKRIYDEYSSLEDPPELYLDHSYTNSVFGMHIILASKGENFEKPSAYFDQSMSEINYSEGSNNLGDLPTIEQLTLYKTLMTDTQSNVESEVLLPDSVYQAIEYYYTPLFTNSVYANTFLIEGASDILDGESSFAINSIDNFEKVLEFYESLIGSILNN